MKTKPNPYRVATEKLSALLIRYCVVFALLLSGASAGIAQISSPVVEAGEWSGTSLTAARWRNFRAANSGWDIAVGKGIGTSATTWANKDFGNLYSFIPGKNIFSYSYNASTGAQTVSADVNGGLQSATQNLGNLSAFNLQISIKAETGKRVEYKNVVLTAGGVDYPLPDFTAMGETKNWKIRFDLSGGFTIKGDAYFDNATCQECSRIDLYLKSVPPASSTKSPLQDVPKDLEGALSVYPNPTLTGQVSFRVSMEGLRQNLGTQSATAEVFDHMGSLRLLRVVTLDNTGRGSLDASSLPRGTYTLQVKVAGMTYTTRLKRE